MVERVREMSGGQLAPQSATRLRWYLADLEKAQRAADGGDLSAAAQLCDAMRQDGDIAGLMSTRTGGLVRLPKKFRGHSAMCGALMGQSGARSVFDDMFPPAELALFAADGIFLGVSVGELVPVEGRSYPVFVRMDPQFLRFRWAENRWYYASIAGLLPITPGDGRWVLHVPGGRIAPWRNGLWRALGKDWINKEQASLHRSNWEGKLANPARAATAPMGATENQRIGFLKSIIAWGINTVFELPVGWDVKLIESNGRGYEAFGETIDRANRSISIALAGQVVTTEGGAGFSNADIHAAIRFDLIQDTAESLAYTLNTQGLPPWVLAQYGELALDHAPQVSWDVSRPRDLTSAATSLQVVGQAIEALRTSLKNAGLELDVRALCERFAVPVQEPAAATAEEVDLYPIDVEFIDEPANDDAAEGEAA